MSKDTATLKSITITCGKTGKEVVVPASVLQWSVRRQECEMCGSHGDATVEFECPDCGKTHEIEVYSF